MTTYAEIFNAAADKIQREGHFTGGSKNKGTCIWLAIRQATLDRTMSIDEDLAIRRIAFNHFNLDPEGDVIGQIYALNDAHDQQWAIDQLHEMARKSEVTV